MHNFPLSFSTSCFMGLGENKIELNLEFRTFFSALWFNILYVFYDFLSIPLYCAWFASSPQIVLTTAVSITHCFKCLTCQFTLYNWIQIAVKGYMVLKFSAPQSSSPLNTWIAYVPLGLRLDTLHISNIFYECVPCDFPIERSTIGFLNKGHCLLCQVRTEFLYVSERL